MTKITISGRQGAGKTRSGKILAEKLNYKNLSIGDLRGELAKERGLTIDELNEIGKKEDWVHKKADEKTIELGKTKNDFVIEGWIAYHFIPDSFKIFLDVKESVAVKRIFLDQREDEKECKTEKEMKEMLNKRLKITREQFRKYYGVDFMNKKDYNLIIDTTKISPQEVVEIILTQLKNIKNFKEKTFFKNKKMYNIFSKEKAKKEKQIKEIVQVDFREKNSLVPSELIKKNLTVEFKELPVGDYLIKGVAIERKSVKDFFASLFDKRLFNQLENLKQYEKSLLIIEGNLKKDNPLHENALRGLLLSIGLNYQTALLFTKDEEETASYIKLIAKKEKKEISLNPKKKKMSPDKELQFVLESFSGIGPTKAKRLLEKFGSLKKVFLAKEKDLEEIIGKNSKEFLKTIKREYSKKPKATKNKAR